MILRKKPNYLESKSGLTIYQEQDLATLSKVHWQDPDKEEAEYYKLVPLTESELSIALLTGNKQELEAEIEEIKLSLIGTTSYLEALEEELKSVEKAKNQLQGEE